MKKRIFSALLISALAVSALTACGGSSSAKKSGQTLTVLNYGKYIDESVVKQFEKETGITVKYEEYETGLFRFGFDSVVHRKCGGSFE